MDQELSQNPNLGCPMKSMTYDDWKLAGYQVKKGEKATSRNSQGRPLFHRDQVMPCVDNPGGPCPVCGYWGAVCQCHRNERGR